MAERGVSRSILQADGRQIMAGVLQLLQEKKTGLVSKTTNFELCPLYWRLVSYRTELYLLGHKTEQPGVKPSKKIFVNGCTTDLKPPKLVMSLHTGGHFLCIQCDNTNFFLKADSRKQRDKWQAAIMEEIDPIYFASSSSSSSSSDAMNPHDASRHVQPAWPRSVRGTAETEAHPGTDWRRSNTSPAGQFPPKAAHLHRGRSSVMSDDSMASSAQALQNRRTMHEDRGMRNPDTTSQVRYNYSSYISSPGSLKSSEVSRPRSLHGPSMDLAPGDIYTDDAQYNGDDRLCHIPPAHIHLPTNRKSEGDLYGRDRQDTYKGAAPLKGVTPNQCSAPNLLMEEDDAYEEMNIEHEDDYYATSVTTVNNLGKLPLRPDEYDDITTDPPPIPERDYVNYHNEVDPAPPTSVKSSTKRPAPQPPTMRLTPAAAAAAPTSTTTTTPKPLEAATTQEESNYDMYAGEYYISIEREKTVVLERDFQNVRLESLKEKTDEGTEKTVRPAAVEEAQGKVESLDDYVRRFRSEHFDTRGITVTVPKRDISPSTIKLIPVNECICVAAIPGKRLRSKLHVDDVIVKVNAQNLPSIDFCFQLFNTTDEEEVQLLVKRVAHGVLSHVTLSANGGIDALGLEFGNSSQGIEVTKINGNGLVAKSGNPSKAQTTGAINGGILLNWGLVEINQSPVPLHSTPSEVKSLLRNAGCELALVFVPMDIVHVFQERVRGDGVENEASKC